MPFIGERAQTVTISVTRLDATSGHIGPLTIETRVRTRIPFASAQVETDLETMTSY